MNCRVFREKHVAFVDDTLPGIDLVEMQRHVGECFDCAGHDAKIRRALLLIRNLPTIQPSPAFFSRLEAKLAESRLTPIARGGVRKRMTIAAMLSAAAMIGYIVTTLYRVESTRDLIMAPVVASVPESEMAPLASPPATILASAPAGLAIWPATLFAEQAPMRFAHTRFANVNLER